MENLQTGILNGSGYAVLPHCDDFQLIFWEACFRLVFKCYKCLLPTSSYSMCLIPNLIKLTLRVLLILLVRARFLANLHILLMGQSALGSVLLVEVGNLEFQILTRVCLYSPAIWSHLPSPGSETPQRTATGPVVLLQCNDDDLTAQIKINKA